MVATVMCVHTYCAYYYFTFTQRMGRETLILSWATCSPQEWEGILDILQLYLTNLYAINMHTHSVCVSTAPVLCMQERDPSLLPANTCFEHCSRCRHSNNHGFLDETTQSYPGHVTYTVAVYICVCMGCVCTITWVYMCLHMYMCVYSKCVYLCV